MARKTARDDEGIRLGEMICFDLHAASRAMTAAYRPLLEPLGLTYPQYLMLVALWESGSQSVGELMQRLQLEYGTVSPLLKRLEARGLVTRTRNPADERQVLVALTGEGEAMRRHAPGIYRAICAAFDLTPERAAVAHDVLRRIAERAERAGRTG